MNDCNIIQPYVSVIIPTFNRQAMLTDALESVLKQSCSNLEVIIVDDGSTDDTEQVVKKFEDKRIKYVKQANQGVSAARNHGIRLSSGEYIALLDSDDVYELDCIERKLDVVGSGSDIVLVGGGCAYFNDVKENCLPVSSARDSITYEDLCIFTAYPGGACNIFARRDAVLKCGGFDEQLPASEDRDLLIKLSIEGKIASVNGVTVKVRVHNECRPNRDLKKIAVARDIVSSRVSGWQLRQRSRAWTAMMLGVKSWQDQNRLVALYYWFVSFVRYPFTVHREKPRCKIILRDYLLN